MEGKNLYVSNGMRMNKRGKIVKVEKDAEDNLIFTIEGKKKQYIFSTYEYSMQETEKTITMIK